MPGSSGFAIPATEDGTPLLWTDQSRADRWQALQAAIAKPTVEGFRAYVIPMTSPALHGLGEDAIRTLPGAGDAASFVLVADARALADDELPILVVDLSEDRQPSFRVIARCLWAVENNLSLANMDWQDFAGAVDLDGILRAC